MTVDAAVRDRTTEVHRAPTGRFAALVALAVAITLSVADVFSVAAVADRARAGLRCEVLSGVYRSAANRPDPDPGKWLAYRECVDALHGDRVLWLVGGVALLGLVTWLLLLARRGRAPDLHDGEAPVVRAATAVWWAVLLVAVLPFAVGLGWFLPAGNPVRLLWFPVLVLLACAAVVSVRRHADPRPGFAEFFLAAVAWQVVAGTLGISGARLGPGPPLVEVGWSLGVGALVCLSAWRGAARPGRDRRRVFVAPGLGIGLGVAVGTLVSPDALSDPAGFRLSAISAVPLVVGVGVTVLVCAWAGACAVLLGDRVRGVRGAAVAAAVLVVCWGCLGWLPTAHDFPSAWADTLSPGLDRLAGLAGGGVDSVVLRLVTLTHVTGTTAVVLTLVWLVPALLARPARAAFTVGAAGFACGASAAVVTAWVMPATTPEAVLVLAAWQFAVVAVVQLAAAVAARRAGVVAALVSAWLTGLGGGLAIWLTHRAGGAVDAVLAEDPLRVLAVTAVAAGLLAAVPFAAPPAADALRRVPRLLLAPAVLVTAVALLAQPVAPTSVALLPPRPTTPDLDPARALAVWRSGGGLALVDEVVRAQDRSSAGIAERHDRVAVVELCDRQLHRVRAARGFPAPPEATARDHWNNGLDASRAAAERCQRAFASPAGDPGAAAAQFDRARVELGSLLRLLPGSGAWHTWDW